MLGFFVVIYLFQCFFYLFGVEKELVFFCFFNSLLQCSVVEWFGKVVDGVLFEGVNSIFIVSGDKNDIEWWFWEKVQEIEVGLVVQMNIEENKIWSSML